MACRIIRDGAEQREREKRAQRKARGREEV